MKPRHSGVFYCLTLASGFRFQLVLANHPWPGQPADHIMGTSDRVFGRNIMKEVKTEMMRTPKIDIPTLLQMPYLSLDEAALILRVSPQTIRKWVSVNGRTQRPHNPAFPVPVRRSRLTFRTCDILRYHEDCARPETLPSPFP